MAGLIIMAVIAAPLLVLGLLMRQGKGLMLLAGYNTMGEAERAKIDRQLMGKTAGGLLMRMAAEFLLLGVAIYFELETLSGICLLAAIADPVITVIWLNRKISARAGAPYSKGTLIAVVVISAVVLVFVGAVFVDGGREPEVAVEGGSIRINAVYGTDISLDDVTAITLDERSMGEIAPDAHRSNGYGGFGDALRGNFTSGEAGPFLAFVRSKSAPTILITRADEKPVYISMEAPADTRALYEYLEAFVMT